MATTLTIGELRSAGRAATILRYYDVGLVSRSARSAAGRYDDSIVARLDVIGCARPPCSQWTD